MHKVTRLVPRSIRDLVRDKLEQRFGRIEMARPYEIFLDAAHKPLAGKVAVVTGASGSIGRAIAIRLAVEGAFVIAVARNAEKLQAVVSEIISLGGAARHEVLDLADANAVGKFGAGLDGVQILINNAGGSSRARNAPIWEQTSDTIDDVLSVNLRSTMLTTASVGRVMVGGGTGGRIINLGSTVAVGGLPRFSDYAAAKSGVVGYTRSAALEFGPHNITVNCVTPGIIKRGQISQQQATATLRKGVLPALGREENIAEMVAFLAGSGGAWITGQELIVDGGRSIGLHGEL